MMIYIVARHYPPEISGGARRPSLMAQALRKRGFRVRVITPFEAGHSDDLRVGNVALPPKSDHGPTPARRPSALKTFVARWTRWPDSEVGWARKVASRLGQLDPPDWIITTSPPESIHTVGWHAKRIWKDTRWLAEFRDTWTVNAHRPEMRFRLRRAIERRMARQILLDVDALVAVSPAVMDEIGKYAPKTTPALIEGHFSDDPPAPHTFPDTEFNVVHSGGFALSDPRRELRALLYAMTPIASHRPELRLHITGGLDVAEQALCDGRDWVVTHGRVPLALSRSLQAGADALLLATPENSHALPGKFAEYALSGRPIVATGGGGWRSLVPEGVKLLPLSALATLPAGLRTPLLRDVHVDMAAQRLERFLEGLNPDGTGSAG